MRCGTLLTVNPPTRLKPSTARPPGGWRGVAQRQAVFALADLLRCWRILPVILGAVWFASSARAADTSFSTLTNFPQVLALSRAEATDDPQPVRVRGVVAFPARGPRDMFHLHSGTNGLGVTPLSVPGLRIMPLLLPQIGQLVEVEGETTFGSSHPFVARAKVRVLGPGQFPEPRQTRGRDLAAGRHHGDLVKLRATVLDVARTRGQALLSLNADGYGFYAELGEPTDHLPVEWLGANVEVQGMPWLQFDGAGKVTSFRLLVGSNAWVRVLKPGSSNLFAGPRLTLREVADAPVADDRVVVSGVVTHSSTLNFFTVQDATGVAFTYALTPIAKSSRDGEYVERPTRPTLQAGDRIELVASKNSRRAYAPQLNGAEHRVLGHEELPAPPLITDAAALSGAHDCRRVRIRGRVVDRDAYPQGEAKVNRLWIKFGDLTSYAVHAGSNHVEFPIPTGSMVELTGLCVVDAGTDRPVRRFSIYVDSTSDVRPLAEPPVWTSPTVLRIAGFGGGALTLALGWVWLLRRQVARQTAALRRSNEQLEAEARERVHAEAETLKALAREKELNELKSNFVSMVSHEFRTPLGVIQSASDVLDRYLDRLPPEKRRKHLDMIFRSTKNLTQLVEGVLLLGKVEDGRLQCAPTAIDLPAACTQLVDEVISATTAASPIEFAPGPGLDSARCDVDLLRHIVANLLTNAVKYSAPGTPVKFTVERQGTNAVLTVCDHGIGIADEDRAHLFQSFARGRNVGPRPGTGLGLVIVKRCVELHSGTIELQSALGQGTTVTVTLPVFGDAARADSNPKLS